MTDDIVFCAKTGRMIVEPPSAAPSNVIPFPRRGSARPKPDTLSYAERVTIRTIETSEHIDRAVQDGVAAIVQAPDDLEDI